VILPPNALLAVASGAMSLAAIAVGRRDTWTRSLVGLETGLILAIGSSFSAGVWLAVLRGNAQHTYNVFGERLTLLPSYVDSLSKLGVLAIVVLGGGYWFHSLTTSGSDAFRSPGAVLLGAPIAASLAALMRGTPAVTFRQIALVAVILASVKGARTGAASLGAAYFGLGVSALSGLSALLHSEVAFAACREDKCGFFGSLFYGVFVNENALGLTLVMSLPHVYLTHRGVARWLGVAALSGGITLSGSRTAELALAVTALAFVATSRAKGFSLNWLRSGVVIALLTSCTLPLFYLGSPEALTNRPALWKIGLEGFRASPWLGQGWNAQQLLYAAGGGVNYTSSYSIHHEILDLLFSAGVVGLASFLWMLSRVVSGVNNLTLLRSTLILTPLFAAGLLERPWSLSRVDWLSWSLCAFLLSARTCWPDQTFEVEPTDSSSTSRIEGRRNGAVSRR
jgi:hypothetical protein